MSFIDKEKERPFLFKIVKEIGKWNKEYKKELVKNITFLHPETKEELYVSNKNIQDACIIIKANNKTESKKLVRLLVKDVVCERTTDSEITEAYEKIKMRELKEKAKFEKIERSKSGLRTIEDYVLALFFK